MPSSNDNIINLLRNEFFLLLRNYWINYIKQNSDIALMQL